MKKLLVLLIILAVAGIILLSIRSNPEQQSFAVPSPVERPTQPVDSTAQPVQRMSQRIGPDEIYPRADLSPGLPNRDITQENITETICNRHWTTSSVRPPGSYISQLKRSQIDEYGFADTNTADYEEDHIISLENGGDPKDPRNLYPEPYYTDVNGQRIGAHEKDAVENYVHNGICLDIPSAKFSSGPKPKHSLSLAQGQQILANDWYACYVHMKAGEDCAP